jgi:hypothetical protein
LCVPGKPIKGSLEAQPKGVEPEFFSKIEKAFTKKSVKQKRKSSKLKGINGNF